MQNLHNMIRSEKRLQAQLKKTVKGYLRPAAF